MKRILPLACITCIVLLIAFGCAVNAPDTGDPTVVVEEEPLYPEEDQPDSTYNFELSIAETPSEIAGFDGVYIDFDKIEVCKGKGDDEEWVTVNEDGGEVDILYLAGGGEQKLAFTDLEPGDYNELRFHVSKVWVIVDGEEIELKISSKILKFMKNFKIEEGETTQLVADFDFHESFRHIQHFRHYKFFKHLLKKFMLRPVMRMMKKHEIGMIKGQIVYPEYTEVTVNAYRDGEDEIYKTTKAFCNGWFFLAYMEEGYYDLVFEAEGYSGREEDVKVKVGKISYIGKIELEEVSEGGDITVTVLFDGQVPVSGHTLYITSFPAGANILKSDSSEVVNNGLDGRIETIIEYPTGNDSITLTLDNGGNGYPSGSYAIRVHIDRDISNGGDFSRSIGADSVAFAQVNIAGGPAGVEINGPWGTYFQLICGHEIAPPSDVDNTKSMYLSLVANGDSWGNYAYGEGVVSPAIVSFFGIDCWSSDTIPNTGVEPYSLYACIDMNNDWDTDPYPNNGDYVIEGGPLSVSVLRGEPDYPSMNILPHFPISWVVYNGN